MLKNDDNKIFDKLAMTIFLALLGSLLSALYLSKMDFAEMSYNHIQTSATVAGITSIFEQTN